MFFIIYRRDVIWLYVSEDFYCCLAKKQQWTQIASCIKWYMDA